MKQVNLPVGDKQYQKFLNCMYGKEKYCTKLIYPSFENSYKFILDFFEKLNQRDCDKIKYTSLFGEVYFFEYDNFSVYVQERGNGVSYLYVLEVDHAIVKKLYRELLFEHKSFERIIENYDPAFNKLLKYGKLYEEFLNSDGKHFGKWVKSRI